MTSDEEREWPPQARPFEPVHHVPRVEATKPAGPAEAAEPTRSAEVVGPVEGTARTEPLVEAVGLGKHHRLGWVYRDVDLMLPVGGVAAVIGGAGSGRSSLLLTLSGRMRHNAGELRVAGFKLPRRGRRVRRMVSVARIGGAVEPEGRFTVRETLAERRSLDGVRAKRAQANFDDACDLLGLDVDPYALVKGLPVVDRALLALAMALLANPVLVVLDDVDAGLQTYEQRELWRRMRAVAATRVSVAASTADATPAYGLLDAAVPLRGQADTVADQPTDVDGLRRGSTRTGAHAQGGQP